jgi:hypothetical protein
VLAAGEFLPFAEVAWSSFAMRKRRKPTSTRATRPLPKQPLTWKQEAAGFLLKHWQFLLTSAIAVGAALVGK